MTNQSNRMDRFVQDLERQARSFAARNGSEEGMRTRSLIVADFEFLWDRSRHHGYKTQVGSDAGCSRDPMAIRPHIRSELDYSHLCQW